MKLFRSVSVNRRRSPQDLYEAICRLRPEGRRSDFFFLEAKPGDEESARLVEQILAMCRERGLEQTRGKTVGSYVYSAARIYEPADLAAAPLLFLSGGRGYLHDLRRDESGLLVIPAGQATTVLKLKAAFTAPWVVVSEAVRQTLLRSNLIGVEFNQTVVEGRSSRAARTPLWELSSSLSLPQMVNSVRSENTPYPCYKIDDDSYQRPEIRYRRSSIAQVGTFDIACTAESLGHWDRSLIISQRFYQCCLANRIPIDAWPVRIEEE